MNLSEAAQKFAALSLATQEAHHNALEKVCGIIEDEVKAVIGTNAYNWPPLSESTIAKHGGDTPLLETGALQSSMQHTVHGSTAFVGTNDKKAEYHEGGTKTIPPRPFLLGALLHKQREIEEALHGEIIVKVFK